MGNAKKAVNLPGKIMEEIKKEMEKAPNDLFVESAKHVYKLMEKDSFIRFLSSPFFEKMVFFVYGGTSEKGISSFKKLFFKF